MEELSIHIPLDRIELEGILTIPKGAQGLILFAHGSGSSRHSPRNQWVAKELQKAHLATLLVDLLTQEEEGVDRQTAHLRFDIAFLATRLLGITEWLAEESNTKYLKIGYFGASTGAAAALQTAAHTSQDIFAIVSRGGRPDLAGALLLSKVRAPVLLIVGGEDYPVIDMNQEALKELHCEKKMVVIPGATHLFEESGTLAEVARLASDWFRSHLSE